MGSKEGELDDMLLGTNVGLELGNAVGKTVGLAVPKHVPTILQASFHNMLVVKPGSKPYDPQ